MQKALFFSFLLLLTGSLVRANDKDSLVTRLLQEMKLRDSVDKVMKYETGTIKFSNGIAQLTVPQGFKYLNAQQSNYILHDVWGNPPQPDVMGMLFPEDGGPYADSSYAFVITWQAMGYVKDEDADKIDYDEMLKQLQKDEVKENEERKKMGYGPIHIAGWAEKPYYDKANKVLHWAKELQFGDSKEATLNYDVRILGRKGILSMNAVAGMNQLGMVKKDIKKVLHIATFTEGNKYGDFNPKIDEVAAWGIGALVAGKILAKVGIWAFLAKFFKPILLGLTALGGAIAKLFKRKNAKDEVSYERVTSPNDEPVA